MKRCAVMILTVAAIAAQASAAKPVTVKQLEQILTVSQKKTDTDLAQQISYLELGERLTSARLEQFQNRVAGTKSRQALAVLADSSAFLSLPADEIPQTPAPDLTTQKRIMGLVVAYVGRTIPQLPNFIATRKTIRFEDTPLTQRFGTGFTPYEPLHLIDVTDATVIYRDGHEVVDTTTAKNHKPHSMDKGLATRGVFGPILGTVLLDAAQSKLAWSHWEQGPSALQAVFSYSVPREGSHYEVNYCCIAEEAAIRSANVHPFQKIVGYHGEIAVDPTSGTILRLTAEAEMKPDDPVNRAQIMVEYGSVEIGGKSYVCPIRSVSSTRAQVVQLDPVYKMPLAREAQPLMNSLSDVSFENYHVFRSESRILAGNEAPGAPPEPSVSTVPPSAQSSSAAQPSSAERTSATAASPQSETAVAQEPAAASPQPETQAAVARPEETAPEITSSSAAGLPAAAAEQPMADTGFTLKSVSRLVDLSVVAFDRKGHPITDLKQEDFIVYDNGVQQKIRFFSQAGNTAQTEPAASAVPPPAEGHSTTYANRPPAAPATDVKNRAEPRTTVLLIDSSNLAWADFTYAREEVLRFLKTVPPDEPVGLYVLRAFSLQILAEPTPEHASLADILKRWIPSAQDLARAQDEEQRNRQQFDWVSRGSDLAYVNGNAGTDPETFDSSGSGVAAVEMPPDARLRQLGNNPGRDALFVLRGVARHLAAIPGHKNLVWVASDNVLASWRDQAASKEDKGSDFIHDLAVQAQEDLNEAHVSIYPLDASQLEAGVIGADLRERNISVVGYNSRSNLAEVPGGGAVPGFIPGRETARMQQDLHPIQGEFRDLAEATGGRALRRAGDIAGELNGIVEDGRAAYQLSFSPAGPADDKYHAITVKVAGRTDITLRYRKGFLYARDPATMKDRFRQATWQPGDTTEIGLTAEPRKTEKGYALLLNVAATDLLVKEQDGFWTGALDVFLIARREDIASAHLVGKRLGLRLKPATYQRALRDGISLEESVALKPDDGSVRVLVVDENSRRIGSVTLPASALGK